MMRDSANRTGGTSSQDWKQMSSPHGYDQPEFEPGQAPRDFKRSRRHEPDDERRRLRNANAAMEGRIAEDAEPHEEKEGKSEKWDNEDQKQMSLSRLYRD